MANKEFTGWRKATASAENGACVEVGWRKSSYSDANGACVEVGWRKSSHSAGNGDCVEVGWRKSSYSAANGECVEVAADRRVIGVRDTQQRGLGITLEFPLRAWRAFIVDTKAGCA